MKMIKSRITLVAIISLIPTLFGIASSYASTNPGPIYSTYSFSSNLYGQSNFTVYGTNGVHMQIGGTSGPSEQVSMTVEIQTCGFFGCHWNGATVGGSCVRTVYNGSYAVCNWSVPSSNVLHRIDFTKAFNGKTISGYVTIQ